MEQILAVTSNGTYDGSSLWFWVFAALLVALMVTGLVRIRRTSGYIPKALMILVIGVTLLVGLSSFRSRPRIPTPSTWVVLGPDSVKILPPSSPPVTLERGKVVTLKLVPLLRNGDTQLIFRRASGSEDSMIVENQQASDLCARIAKCLNLTPKDGHTWSYSTSTP